MNERLKALRKTLGLTQRQFGNRLGIQDTAISKIENGANNLTDAMVKLICAEFTVNEAWLRNGDKPVFLTDINDRFAALIGKILASGDDFQKELLTIIMELDERQIKELKNIAYRLTGTKLKE
jgi:transcriptional regulator with XRE-family HTH domain